MTTEDLISFVNHIAQLERVATAATKFCEDQHIGSLMDLRREVEYLKPPPEQQVRPVEAAAQQ